MTDGRTSAGVGACIEAPVMAAYVDGTLGQAERARVNAHLADCDTCREWLAETVRTLEALNASAGREASGGGTVVPLNPRRRRWHVVGALAAAAVLIAALFVPWRQVLGPERAGGRPELATLVAAVGSNRPFEPRLTGGFAYGPLAPVLRSGQGGAPEPSPDVRIAAARLAQARQERPSPDTSAALASAELVSGHIDAAVALLEQATRERPDAAAWWSDLAAAHLVAAEAADAPARAADALAAADRALAIEPGLREAAFNRGLALERLGRNDEARSAWRAYLAAADRDPWADEARRRLAALERK